MINYQMEAIIILKMNFMKSNTRKLFKIQFSFGMKKAKIQEFIGLNHIQKCFRILMVITLRVWNKLDLFNFQDGTQMGRLIFVTIV